MLLLISAHTNVDVVIGYRLDVVDQSPIVYCFYLLWIAVSQMTCSITWLLIVLRVSALTSASVTVVLLMLSIKYIIRSLCALSHVSVSYLRMHTSANK